MAGRDNGFPAKDRRKIVLAAGESYRTAMREFAEQTLMDVWYAHLDIEQAIGTFRTQMKKKRFKAASGLLAKAHTSDSTKALRKLTTVADGRRRIISDPPMIVPIEEVYGDIEASMIYDEIRIVLSKYGRALQSDRRHLLGQLTLVQVARKVVGGGQRRYPRLDRADGRRGRHRAAVPAGQRGSAVGPGGVQRAQSVQQRGRAGGGRAAPDAGRE